MTLPTDFNCETCGACCSFSSTRARISTKTDSELDAILARFVSEGQRGMRCDGNRCSALAGRVGLGTSCLIYELRPDVCRAFVPRDGAYLEARSSFGLD